jgi:Cell wall-active antibiotics response 4TMS YvqF
MLAPLGSLPMRALRSLGLVTVGVYAGFAGAAAVLKRVLPSRGDAGSDEVALVAIFDGAKLRSSSQAFRGGSMLAWFGGVAVDLREAELAPGAHLSLHSLFGGIAVRVPTGWRVESSARAFAGGVAVNVPEPDDPDAPTLTIDGFAVFGGIAVGAQVAEAAFDE